MLYDGWEGWLVGVQTPYALECIICHKIINEGDVYIGTRQGDYQYCTLTCAWEDIMGALVPLYHAPAVGRGPESSKLG